MASGGTCGRPTRAPSQWSRSPPQAEQAAHLQNVQCGERSLSVGLHHAAHAADVLSPLLAGSHTLPSCHGFVAGFELCCDKSCRPGLITASLLVMPLRAGADDAALSIARLADRLAVNLASFLNRELVHLPTLRRARRAIPAR